MITRNIALPKRKIELDGTSYYIHGLVHGNPWVNVNPVIKKKINEQLQGYNVICEDGFNSWIPHAVSMDETGYFNIPKLSFFNTLRCMVSLAYFHLFEKMKPKSDLVSKIESMKTIEELILIRNELFKNYPNEPEGMNTLMEKTNSGTIDAPTNAVPLRVKRYIYESLFAVDYVKKNKLDELHLVIGCAHERPLEFLLSHKEVLNKYFL